MFKLDTCSCAAGTGVFDRQLGSSLKAVFE